MTTVATAPPALIGIRGQDLTGVECRILRAALGLERRHVARFAQAMGYGSVDPTPERITAWERAKGLGYPADLVQGLTSLEDAVEGWARAAAEEAAGNGEGEAVLLRPLGHRYAFAQLDLALYGLTLSGDQLAALDDVNGEFWHALADTAIARAALYLRRADGWQGGGGVTRVEMDREPDEGSRPQPTAKAAPADRPRNIYRDPTA